MMKKTKISKSAKLLALIIALIMAMPLGLAACGSSSGEESEADDGQNPVMNFVGNYACDRASMFISADEKDGASAIVTWGSSANENSSWMMSGTFDTENLQFEYSDCVRTDYVYDDEGNVTSQKDAYTNGHGVIQFTEGDPLTLTWQDDEENIADGMVFEFTGSIPENGGQSETGMANPWSEAESLAEAAEGAGLDGFDISEGSEISLGEIKVSAYRYMEGMAEAVVEFPAVTMTIRKGLSSTANVGEGDISGDYNEYANEWTQNIKGLEVTCYGNREGEATKTIWQLEDVCYSITAYGEGGDEDFGLSADDISSLINGIQ